MSPNVAGQCRQCSRPGAKRRDHAVVGGFPLRDFSVIGTTAEGFWARTVEHGVRATREPSRVGALRARHAAARPVRLFRRPGAERRQRRAQRGAPCSRDIVRVPELPSPMRMEAPCSSMRVATHERYDRGCLPRGTDPSVGDGQSDTGNWEVTLTGRRPERSSADFEEVAAARGFNLLQAPVVED